MSGYGVDTDDWRPLPWSWAAERLLANRNYWVTTVSADHRPHSMPVWGQWDPDTDTFGFSCHPDAFKARNIAGNPAVVISTDDTVEAVSVEADATPMPDGSVDGFVARYVAKYAEPDGQEAMDVFIRSNAMFMCTPVRALAVIEREDEFATRATRWVFPG